MYDRGVAKFRGGPLRTMAIPFASITSRLPITGVSKPPHRWLLGRWCVWVCGGARGRKYKTRKKALCGVMPSCWCSDRARQVPRGSARLRGVFPTFHARRSYIPPTGKYWEFRNRRSAGYWVRGRGIGRAKLKTRPNGGFGWRIR